MNDGCRWSSGPLYALGPSTPSVDVAELGSIPLKRLGE